MGRSRYKIVDPQLPHFVTCTVLHWIPVFTRPETVTIVLDSLRFLQAEGLKLFAYVILENHLHMVVQSDNLEHDTVAGWSAFNNIGNKNFFTRKFYRF